jgi:hypothetical protein
MVAVAWCSSFFQIRAPCVAGSPVLIHCLVTVYVLRHVTVQDLPSLGFNGWVSRSPELPFMLLG